MELREKIKKYSEEFLPEIISVRRHLHSHPELSFSENETSAFILGKLKSYGIPCTGGIAGTGIVAIVEGKNPSGNTVALRGDMDALPIQEIVGREYGSLNPGVMHACGHDAHSASLLGAAKVLNETRSEWEGTVKFIFQPGEEKLPGGASLMIKEGALENPRPASIFGQHVTHLFPAGKVGFRKGLYMASTDELYVTVQGKGGHAAIPAGYINPLLIASEIIIALNSVFMDPETKNIPDKPTVLAFGKITGNGATNVIPDQVKLEGTFRTMDEEWRSEAHERMIQIARSKAQFLGGDCDFKIVKGYPFLINDPDLTDRSRKRAEEYLGKENVIDLDLWMASEDFAYYSQVMPACFYRLGIRNDVRGITSPVHTGTFDIDEQALLTGMGLMAWLAVSELG